MSLFRLTGRNFCCGVITKNGVIVRTAPLLNVFKHQSIKNLKSWAAAKHVRIEKVEVRK